MKRVSIILPSYKPNFYIYDCIRSVCEQTLDISLFELIIVLNGCDEPYYSNIDNYCSDIQKKPFIQIIQIDEPGVSNARNIGMNVARGEYICFLDDDDILSPTYIEKLLLGSSSSCVGLANVKSFVKYIEESNDDFFLSKYYRKRNLLKKKLYNFRGYFSVPVAKLIHKDLIGNIQYDTRLSNGEDSLFITTLCLRITDFNFTEEDAIYYVRIRRGSASRQKIKLKKLLYLLVHEEWEYIKLLYRNRETSKFFFFLSRIPGTLKSIWIMFRN